MVDVHRQMGAKLPSPWAGAVIGLFTGLISAAASLGLTTGETQFELLTLLPGIGFGIAFAAFLLGQRLVGPGGAVAIALANALGNFVAMRLAMAIADVLDDPIGLFEGSLMIGLPAGLVGGGLAALVFGRVIGVGRPWQPVVVGVVLGPLGPLSLTIDALIPFFGLWQAGFGAALIWTLHAARTRTTA
ncbi:hypothetical protein D3874_15070 [Oleomonas cavernae]|uniref:Uncharacterized protein n=1 Tax=Oleomonas cavernae TaxID=2320859 RepID=A0A418WDR9_9PROT|nr:hypothetical protein [Oleomonas cavernae]RJF88173.1 hypothetical protein D3874_15070 [Oleomonas cavernae]